MTYTPIGPEHGLLFAWRGDTGERIDAGAIEEAAARIDGEGWGWIHLDGNREAAEAWVRARAGEDVEVADVLLAPITRPRCEVSPERVLFVGRGVNLNPDRRPEDMVSVRMWLTRNALVTVILWPVQSTVDISAQLGKGEFEPEGPGDVLVAINRRLTERLAPAVAELKESLDEIYGRIIDEEIDVKTGELAPLRSRTIGFHRYISPLSVEMAELASTAPPWLGEHFRAACREHEDRLTRLAEDLAAVQARAAVARDEIVSQGSERLNRRVYTLTVLAAIFLPLTVLTGALGMNVAGMPGAEHPASFWITMGLLALFVGVELLVLRRIRWL
jgi:zinc transporter